MNCIHCGKTPDEQPNITYRGIGKHNQWSSLVWLCWYCVEDLYSRPIPSEQNDKLIEYVLGVASGR